MLFRNNRPFIWDLFGKTRCPEAATDHDGKMKIEDERPVFERVRLGKDCLWVRFPVLFVNRSSI